MHMACAGAEYLFAGIDCKGPLTSVVSGFMKPKTALKNSQVCRGVTRAELTP
jgi:hypothetical protein